MLHWIKILTKTVWVSLNVMILIWFFVLTFQTRWEEQILLFYAMNALSFPSGLLAYRILAWLLYLLFPITSLNDYVDVSIMWAGVFAAGYLQWFKLLPWLVRKLRAMRFSSKKPESISTNDS